MANPTFDGYAPEALQFLNDLQANNNREWFTEHRKTYETFIKTPTRDLAALLNEIVGELTGTAHKAKIFRINRDIRFSRDKTPYNSHVHLSFSPTQGSSAAWMFGWSTRYLTLGCGTFEFDKEKLGRFHDHVAGDAGGAFENLVGELTANGVRFDEPALKRVPTGFPSDHPRALLLRRKGLMGWIDLEGPDMAILPNLVDSCRTTFEHLLPLARAFDRF